jgi:ribosomal protein L16/L10AE
LHAASAGASEGACSRRRTALGNLSKALSRIGAGIGNPKLTFAAAARQPRLDEVESGSRTIHGRAALHDAHQALPVRDEVRIVRKHRGGRAYTIP